MRIVNGTIWDREDNGGQDIKEKWKYELMNMGHLSIDDLKPLCAGNPNLINKTHTLKHTRELWLSWKERAGVDSKVTVTFTAALQNFPGVRKQDRMWQNMMNVTGIMTNEIYIQSSSAGYYAILNKCFPKLFFFFMDHHHFGILNCNVIQNWLSRHCQNEHKAVRDRLLSKSMHCITDFQICFIRFLSA